MTKGKICIGKMAGTSTLIYSDLEYFYLNDKKVEDPSIIERYGKISSDGREIYQETLAAYEKRKQKKSEQRPAEIEKKEEEREEEKVIVVKQEEEKEEEKKEIVTAERAPSEALPEVIRNAVNYSTILKDIIERQQLYVKIKDRKYVKIEGWQVLAAMLKCHAIVKSVREIKNGWEAEAEVYNMEGKLLSRAIARCTRDEKNWKDRDDYAILSMAQTRACAKAYRLAFAWILGLAGYEPLPAEEVQGE